MPLLTAAPAAAFSAIDWAVVVLYLLGMTAIGLWSRKGQKTQRDYFLGGRDISWWVVGISIVATETSALTFIGIPAVAFGGLKYDAATQTFSVTGGNMFWMMLMSGYVLGRVIIAWKIIPLYYKGEVYTPYQLLSRAFGQPARTAGSVLQLIAIALGAGTRIFITAIPIWVVGTTLAPWWSIWHSIILIIAVSLLYTALGGIKAVVWTDLVQYFIYIGGGLFTLFYVPFLIRGDISAPSGAMGWGAVFEIGKDHMRWFNAGLEGDSFRAVVRNLLCGDYNLFMGLIPGTLGIVLAFGFDQLNVQRLLACRHVDDSRKAMLMSAALIVPQFLLFLMIGVVLYAFYSAGGFDFGLPPWSPDKPEVAKSDYVFPIFIVTHMPAAVRGFLIAAILAAAMSSVSAALSALGSMMTMDIYRPLFGKAGGSHGEVALSRVMTIVAGVVLGLVAWAASRGQNIIDLAFTLAGLTGGGILGSFVYGMIHKRGHYAPVVAGLFVSLIFMALLNYSMNPGLFPGLPRIAIPRIAWPWHPLIGMIACLGTIYALRPFCPTPHGLDIEAAEAESPGAGKPA